MKPKKILFITQEMVPYVGETVASLDGRKLPQALQEQGCEIRTFMPRWGIINERRNQLHEVIRLSGMNIIIDDTDHPLIIKVAHSFTAFCSNLCEQFRHLVTLHRHETNSVFEWSYVENVAYGYISLGKSRPYASHVVDSKVRSLTIFVSCPHENVCKKVGEQSFRCLCCHVSCSLSHYGRHKAVNSQFVWRNEIIRLLRYVFVEGTVN